MSPVAKSTASRWIEPAARFGLVARGVTYGTIAVLAIVLAAGFGGTATGQKGALRVIADAPLGRVLVIIVGVGLLGFAAWRFIQAFVDTDDEGSDASGIAVRLGRLVSAVVHAALGALALSLAAGSGAGGGSGGTDPQNATGGVLGWPAGPVIVGVAGVVVIGVAVAQVHKGLTCAYMSEQRPAGRSGAGEKIVRESGRIGYVARGLVFALAGVFLLKAAIEYDPQEAVGLSGALTRLLDQPAGPALLGVVAVGLLAFAVFSIAQARYRSI